MQSTPTRSFTTPIEVPGLSELELDAQLLGVKSEIVATANVFACVVALGFSGIGAGILALPWALSTWGLMGGILLLLATSLISFLALAALLDAKTEISSKGGEPAEYENLGYSEVIAYFWPYPSVVNVVILIDCFGALVVFVDFCASAFQSTAGTFGFQAVAKSPAIVKCGLCAIVVPFAMPRSITRAATLSPLCLGALFYVCTLVVKQAVAESVENHYEPSKSRSIELFAMSTSSLKGMCAFFFAFVCHMNVFSVARDLCNPTPQRQQLVAGLATVLMGSIYGLVAVCGYIAFGANVKPDVLDNFNPQSFDVRIANIAMVCMLLVCFILVVYPVRDAILGLLSSSGAGGNQEATASTWTIVTLFISAATAVVSIAFPSIVGALDFLGGFCAPCMIFLFPAMTQRFSTSPVRKGLLMIATVIGFLAFVQAILEAADAEQGM